MTPTAKLRFVERKENASISDPVYVHHIRTVRVLQQWWEGPPTSGASEMSLRKSGEWRDIPIAREE